ncbi:unnamed protein product, partial [Ilex paraguariensis]
VTQSIAPLVVQPSTEAVVPEEPAEETGETATVIVPITVNDSDSEEMSPLHLLLQQFSCIPRILPSLTTPLSIQAEPSLGNLMKCSILEGKVSEKALRVARRQGAQ